MAERAGAAPALQDRGPAGLLRREPRHPGRLADARARRARRWSAATAWARRTLCNTIAGLKRGALRLDPHRRPRDLAARAARDPPARRRLRAAGAARLAEPVGRRASAPGRHRRRRDAPWTVERVYQTFPRLAERREQRRLAAVRRRAADAGDRRALLGNPRLLVMDEPTEGLAPVIVEQVEAHAGAARARKATWRSCVVEQNIGVATAVSDHVAIMVNGRINRVMEARRARRRPRAAAAAARRRPRRTTTSCRRPRAAAGASVEAADGRSLSRRARRGRSAAARAACRSVCRPSPPLAEPLEHAGRPSLRQSIGRSVAARGSKPRGSSPSRSPSASAAPRWSPAPSTPRAASCSFIRDRLKALGIPTRTVDLSTSGKPSTRRRDAAAGGEHASARHVGGVLRRSRPLGRRAMAEAFARWIAREPRIGGVISAGGSGGTTLATAGMRALPVGIPKVMVSTVAAGDVARLCRREPTS